MPLTTTASIVRSATTTFIAYIFDFFPPSHCTNATPSLTPPSSISAQFCSFCIAKDQRECHYSARSRMTPRSAAGTHRRGDATDNVNDAVSGAPLPPGRTFFPTDREELDEGAQRRTPMGARATNGNGQGLPLTLKRCGREDIMYGAACCPSCGLAAPFV